jgi:YjbE family integral membrane protein
MPDFDHMIPELIALGQVIIIDLMLAGDNAIVVGMAAAGLPKHMRAKVILIGISAATVMRILFAVIANQLLVVIGLTLAGGILLLWVCWKFWRELAHERRRRLDASKRYGRALSADEVRALEDKEEGLPGAAQRTTGAKTMRQAVTQIVLADVSMSLDNVLAVAGAAAQHTWVLFVGLILSVALMGIAAGFIASLLKRWSWIAYIGLAIILWVSLSMIYRGSHEVIDKMDDGASLAAPAAAGTS